MHATRVERGHRRPLVGSPRAARIPPVSAPDAMAFHGSSLCRIATSPQSKVEKRPPHTANCPAPRENHTARVGPQQARGERQAETGSGLDFGAAESQARVGGDGGSVFRNSVTRVAVVSELSRGHTSEHRRPGLHRLDAPYDALSTRIILRTLESPPEFRKGAGLWQHEDDSQPRASVGAHQMDPPTSPIPKAPPTSSMMRNGHGSRPCSVPPRIFPSAIVELSIDKFQSVNK